MLRFGCFCLLQSCIASVVISHVVVVDRGHAATYSHVHEIQLMDVGSETMKLMIGFG